jgi:2-oxoglutarate dehydrogenase E2 component (dihydrolipoamide succinyltransferase)
MAENIIMPQLGESIAEGTIVKWLKEPGDEVKKDENILLISTDKVEAEIPSPSAGILLKINVGPGQTVAVGTVLGQVGTANESASVTTNTSAPEEPAPRAQPSREPLSSMPPTTPTPTPTPMLSKLSEPAQPVESPAENNMAHFFSPLVRKIATENGLSESELSGISGTGRGGRISKNDILAYLSQRTKIPKEHPPEHHHITSNDRDVIKPISTMRRVIMENMLASKNTSAHVTTFFEIDYTAIDKIRTNFKEKFQQDEQVSLTYTAFLAAAVCQVLKRHPYINASLTKDAITFKKDINLGIAVALENPEPGLMVPVIKHADMQNLRGLAHAIADLSSRVRARKIKPDELSGGTFTITNPGNYGALIGTPIINQPQVAILGVGQIKKQPIVLEIDGTDVIAIRRIGLLSLSFDHRLIDGATADMFMRDLKNTLETWNAAP